MLRGIIWIDNLRITRIKSMFSTICLYLSNRICNGKFPRFTTVHFVMIVSCSLDEKYENSIEVY